VAADDVHLGGGHHRVICEGKPLIAIVVSEPEFLRPRSTQRKAQDLAIRHHGGHQGIVRVHHFARAVVDTLLGGAI
jgi:hypothetical protein